MKLYKLKPLTSKGKPLPEDIAVDKLIAIDGPGGYDISRWWNGKGKKPKFVPYRAGHCWDEYFDEESKECDTFAEAVAWIEQDRIARVETLCDAVDVPN